MVDIDCKTSRRPRRSGYALLHLVSASASCQHLVLDQEPVAGKGSEITAILRLLEHLELIGALGPKPAQEVELAPPHRSTSEVLRSGHGRAEDERQDLRQRMNHLPRLARILQRRKCDSKDLPDMKVSIEAFPKLIRRAAAASLMPFKAVAVQSHGAHGRLHIVSIMLMN